MKTYYFTEIYTKMSILALTYRAIIKEVITNMSNSNNHKVKLSKLSNWEKPLNRRIWVVDKWEFIYVLSIYWYAFCIFLAFSIIKL